LLGIWPSNETANEVSDALAKIAINNYKQAFQHSTVLAVLQNELRMDSSVLPPISKFQAKKKICSETDRSQNQRTLRLQQNNRLKSKGFFEKYFR
jgi:hypothetical protein